MAKSSVVFVGCRLPNGIILEHPNNPNNKVEIAGTRATKVAVPYVVTEVDRDFWDAWLLVHSDFAPLKNKSLFVESTLDRAQSMGKEVATERTGMERARAEDNGLKAVNGED